VKETKKTLLAILLGCFTLPLALLVGILGLTLVGGLLVFGPPIGPERMERIFVADYELLETVTQFLVDYSDHSSVHIRRDHGANVEMRVSGRNVRIEGANVLEALETLMDRGYSVITMSDNAISFQRWRTRDVGRGIAFSMDGNDPILHALTRLEPLSKPNWFYYESDFFAWLEMQGVSRERRH